MNRSRELRRSFVRSSRERHAGGQGGAGRLAWLAGRSNRAEVERLEPRQLLFSLSITPDVVDPNTGLGTVAAIFGYTVPYLGTGAAVGENESETVLEDFAEVGTGQIPNGFEFDESFLRIKHNVTPGSDIQVIADVGPDGPIDGTERMRLRLGEPGEFISFEFDARELTNADDPDRPAQQMRISFGRAGGQFGLNYNAVRAVLTYRGQTVGTFTGAALRNLNTSGAPADINAGVGEFLFRVEDAFGTAVPFDRIRFEAVTGSSEFFQIDNVTATFTAGNFADIVESRIFGAEIRLTGPVGASVQVLDVYGREMLATIRLGKPQDIEDFVLVDPNDNGIPDFNDGIGRIILRNVDSRASLTVLGGTIEAANDTTASTNPLSLPIGKYREGGGNSAFTYTRSDDPFGIYDQFEDAGFGYALDVSDQEVTATGLPPGPGSVIIGSPFVRNNANTVFYNPGGSPRELTSALVNNPALFNASDQGIFVPDGSAMGYVRVHGVLHGSSNFSSAVEMINVGYLVGSLNVAGDLGGLVVASEAGQWVPDSDFTTDDFTLPEIVKTNSELVVGRTVGEIAIAGRSLMDVTVVGDLDSPALRPPRDSLRYQEKEYLFAIDENADVSADDIFRLMVESNGTGSNTLAGTTLFFGSEYFRNDGILHAEWVNTVGTSVIIEGELGGADPSVNSFEDGVDVFAFAADGLHMIEAQTPFGVGLKIMDQDGRTLGAVETLGDARDSQVLRFMPEAAGVYYLVVTAYDVVDGNFDGTVRRYEVALSGIAPTSLGSYRTGAGTGGLNGGTANTVQVLGGSIGAFRTGTAFLLGDAQEEDPREVFNTAVNDLDEVMRLSAGAITTPENLYAVIAGGDIVATLDDGLFITVGGNLGALYTGLSPLIGIGPQEGDVAFLDLRIGGSIGLIEIAGGVGIDQDGETVQLYDGGLIVETGRSGTGGDIGMIRIGSHVQGGMLKVDTPAGAVVGGILISQDVPDATGTQVGIYTGSLFTSRMISTGLGGDVRFVNFPRIDLPNAVDSHIDLFVGQTVEVTDDSGGKVRVTISGLASAAPVGLIRFIPIDDSEGVAISTISVNLSGGRTLTITSEGVSGDADPVSIGEILVTDSTPVSNVVIDGPLEVDVWRIRTTGGTGLNQIMNSTPNGDIVAIDAIALNSIEIRTGDLGRTQMPAIGPKLIGPDLGIEQGLQDEVGAPLGIPANAMDTNWNGGLYRPIGDTGTNAGNAYIDDIGGPFDGRLNGAVIRSGNVNLVQVGGAIGDVILQGGGAILNNLVADSDRTTPIGEFDGIVGVVFASILATVDVGDGIALREQSPVASSGLFATDEIRTLNGANGADIRGVIIASNTVVAQPTEFGGIQSINLSGGGDFIDAKIGVTELDAFWLSLDFDDAPTIRGNIDSVRGTDADFFRSEITATNINNFILTNGFFDASSYNALNRAGTISAAGFRNSTTTGTNLEFRTNQILVGENLENLNTLGTNGEISDILIDVVGTVTGSIQAHNFIRANIQVDNEIKSIVATGDFRGSNITTGRLTAMNVTRNISASQFTVAGPIVSLIAGNSILNTSIAATGPNGRIDLVQAAQRISGSLDSSGPVGSVLTTVGDIDLNVHTTTTRGTVQLLSAARDLKIRTDISAGVRALVAGRHIGDKATGGIVLIRGDLTAVSVPNGQLYSEIRVGDTVGVNIVTPGGSGSGSGGPGSSVTPGVVIGRATHLTGNSTLGRGSITAFDRIGSVTVNGDFAGSVVSSSNGIASVTINNGSLLPGARIAAYDGNVESVVITNGHLLGDVHADYNITSLRVVGSGDGVFGDVGINPALSANTAYDGFRTQLPLGLSPTSSLNGSRITAGRNITSFVVTNGSVFESAVYAGREITSISITGNVDSDAFSTGMTSFFAAGDRIASIAISGSVKDAFFGAGLFDLGADNRPGGLNAGNALLADTVRNGRIETITIGGNATNVDVVAGVLAGGDGVYNTTDDRQAIGVSSISTVSIGGAGTDVVVSSDVLSASILGSSKLTARAGGPVENFAGDPGIVTSAPVGTLVPVGGLIVNYGGATLTLSLAGAGQAFWNQGAGRLTLSGTTMTSVLTVASNTGTVADFDIVSTNNASIGTMNIQTDLTGDSDIVIDDAGGVISMRNLLGTGTVRFGGDVTTMTVGSLSGGHVYARTIGSFTATGNFGATSPGVRGEASVNMLSGGTFRVNGTMRALLNVHRDITTVNVTGAIDNALIRVGSRLGVASTGSGGAGTAALTAGSIRQSRISVGDELGNVTVTGDMFDSAIMVGGDLGADGDFGGTGLNADKVSTGFGSNITIGGNFFESDIVAGALRGADGFFGTSDDTVADGRSRLGAITIAGTGVGSNRFTESYRISSTGTLGAVTVGGQPGRNVGNFRIVTPETLPAPIQVTDVQVSEASRVYTARIFFNQAIDASTLSRALTVREVRGTSGDVEIFLVQGLDYTLTYDSASNAAVVTFNRDLTARDLPRLAGVPGPGIYRFVLEAAYLRAQLDGALLDGDGDGFSENLDNFTADTIVGDAGDKIVSTTTPVFNGAGQEVHSVDFYGPIDLDVVMDSNVTPDQLPDPNKPYVVRGVIGDHPDNSINFFRFAGDMDLYKLTLQAGQILRLGSLLGSANNVSVNLITPSGLAGAILGQTADFVSLPVNSPVQTQTNVESAYLIKTTGVYYLAVGNALQSVDDNSVPQVNSEPGIVGDYRFSVEVFDDGNSGFADVTDAGDGEDIVDAPLPSAFPGNSTTLTIGGYTYTLNVGPDGVRNTADDIVSGGNGQGVTSVRQNGAVTTTIDSAIGPRGHAGIPGEVYGDVDIFHLNNGNPIAPGTTIQITVKLSAVGGDLGSRGANLGVDSDFSFQDFTGAVQLAVFDTTGATSVDNATLVLSPTDFSPNGGRTGVLADNGETSYGFDANGDFFIRFPAPGRIGSAGAVAASYAVYLQGAFNTDYTLEIVTGATTTLTKHVQNVFIELNGGSINWLEAGGVLTSIEGFDPRVLGLAGSMSNGQPVADYILQRVVARVESVFASAGLAVNVSLNSSDFEFEEFSTIFLTSSNDPISQVFSVFDFFNLGNIAGLSTQPFGFSQHSDPLNADHSDEAVIFLPSFANLGYTPSESDVNALVNSLTAAVGRHVGELMGLRVTGNDNGATNDIFAADAVAEIPDSNENYAVPAISRVLSTNFDSVNTTDFWLGRQNSRGLLDKVLQ